ncbi:uncharacterized protein LOC108927781 isoform X3 [Scleropages formosus]|uniref:uncharacterized protein LOC108927781 isoform X3 n=1 Tax=Scleropages formosus TaxID=113540 RepID=UPI0008787DD9|nr:uncharacterized protein LOC108927781 isoform X3 [Scleropages formosus]
MPPGKENDNAEVKFPRILGTYEKNSGEGAADVSLLATSEKKVSCALHSEEFGLQHVKMLGTVIELVLSRRLNRVLTTFGVFLELSGCCVYFKHPFTVNFVFENFTIRVARTMDGLKSVLLFNVLLPGVACDGWSVWMPGSLEALADSCLLIPCSFDVPDDHADGLRMPAGGVWRKRSRWFEGSTDVFNSSREQNILSGRILGDLLAKNCTTILHGIPRNYSDSYFFRLETGFKLTFETNVNIDVKDSPKNTSATVSPSSSVEGGTWVTLLCSSNSNPPVENYTWFQVQGDEVTPRATGQNFTFNLTATNTGLYYCEAQNQYGTGTSSRVLLTLKGDWNTVLLWAGGGISTPVVLIGVLLCLIRSKKRGESSGSVKTEGQKGGDCHFYGNVDPKVDFKVRPGGAEQSKQGHDDDTYNNSMMMFSAKASCLTNQSGNACAESIYANSDSDGNIYINSISQ